MKRDKQKSALKEIKNFFNSPEFMTEEEFLLEFNSEGELTARGCKDVKEYTEENVLLISEDYYINVGGKNLIMKQFSLKNTVIGGLIENINFIRR